MSDLHKIFKLIEDFTGVKLDDTQCDIWDDLGCVGDDFTDLIDSYADMFKIDMSNYLWYFHNDEEGLFNIGSLFFKAPYQRVERIPVTPQMLADFIPKGKWEMSYPPHVIPAKRYDLKINLFIMLIFAFILFVILYIKFFNS